MPVAIAIGAALLPALAFGGISAGRNGLYFALVAEEAKASKDQAKGPVAHSPLEKQAGSSSVTVASPSEQIKGISRGFAAMFS